MATFTAGQHATAATLERATQTAQGWGRRTSSSSTTTTSLIGVERLDDFPVYSGRFYIVAAHIHTTSSTSTDNIRVDLRYTADGSTPTTSSSVMVGGQLYTTPAQKTMFVPYVPASDQTLSVLLCVVRDSGVGNVSLYGDATRVTDLMILDFDVSPGDTGTDI